MLSEEGTLGRGTDWELEGTLGRGSNKEPLEPEGWGAGAGAPARLAGAAGTVLAVPEAPVGVQVGGLVGVCAGVDAAATTADDDAAGAEGAEGPAAVDAAPDVPAAQGAVGSAASAEGTALLAAEDGKSKPQSNSESEDAGDAPSFCSSCCCS
eukprot:scaffold52276_cov13-Tisochrysis_lutea.AAC.1